MSSTPPFPTSSTPSLIAESIDDQETNTLILTNLSAFFFNPPVLDALKQHFESYGHIHSWAPLKGFSRIVMVYWNTDDATVARTECDEMVLADDDGKTISKTLRIYRGTNTDLSQEVDHLPVPHTTKNFLISPPGSPPVGWEPIEEEPPNAAALASDLIAALHRLQLNRNHPQQTGIQMIMSPDLDENLPGDDHMAVEPTASASSGPGLTVYLEDTDLTVNEGDASGTATPIEEGLFEGERMRGGIGMVKATVASMRRDGTSSPGLTSGLVSPGAGKIARVPTPRPPV